MPQRARLFRRCNMGGNMRRMLAGVMVLAGCAGGGLPSSTGDAATHPPTFESCKACHGPASPAGNLFDPQQPEQYRDAVRRAFSGDDHPYKPSPDELNALLVWSDQG
jgi:hypothetical protein